MPKVKDGEIKNLSTTKRDFYSALKKISYLGDTKEFWQNREEARKNLDAKRANVSYSKKMATVDKLNADTKFLKGGRTIPSKPSPKSSKT